MKKRIISMLLVAVLVFSFAACGKKENSSGAADSNATAQNNESGVTVDTVSGDDASGSANSKKTGSGKQNANSAAANSATGSKGSGGNTTASGNKGTTGGNNNSTTGGNKGGGSNITAANKLKLKSGTKPMEQGLNFKGKTFTMAITEEGQYNTSAFKRMTAAFEKTYNCKISVKTLKFNNYCQQITQQISGGSTYDILLMHGVNYPNYAKNNLAEPLDKYITTADLMDSKDPSAGGIDANKTSYFLYNSKIYGLCHYESCYPYFIYYNKKAFEKAGIEDPQSLEKAGKWTWNKIISLGRKHTNTESGQYFVSNSFRSLGTIYAFGKPYVSVNNGKATLNVTSSNIISGLNMIKKMFQGNSRIAEPNNSASYPYNSSQTLLRGTTYMFMEESSKYIDIAKEINTSLAFERNINNLGIVRVPYGSTNKEKAYPTGWLTAVAAGKGTKDARVAVAWSKFMASYKDTVKDKYNLPTSYDNYRLGLLSGNICCESGSWASSDTDTRTLLAAINSDVASGKDVSQTVTKYKDKMQHCLNVN